MVRRPGWGALLDVIRLVARVEDLDDFGPVLLEAIERLVPADIASWNEVDPVARRAVVVARPVQPTRRELGRWQELSHQNPCLMHALHSGDGSARRISDFLSREALHELELYRAVYRPLGIEYQVSLTLPAPAPLVLGLALNRGARDFTDEEVRALDTLRPHLAQAYRGAQLLTERARALASVAGELEEEGRAFCMLDGPPSSHARRLLDACFGPGDGGLPGPVASWAEREREAFRSGEPYRLRHPLVTVHDGRRLTIRFVPGRDGPDLLWLDDRAAEADAGSLRRLGLSVREAEVLWLLTEGRATKEIARRLGVSLGTVKKHLEHVYRKLGVSNATSAVALAFNALASMSGPRHDDATQATDASEMTVGPAGPR